MIIYAQRLVEVPTNASVPKPYLVHNAKDISGLINEWFEV
jgi:hypothetical protein